MWVLNWTLFILCLMSLSNVYSETIIDESERNSSSNGKSKDQMFYEVTENLEIEFKKIIKKAVRQVMPYMLQLYEVEEISQDCIRAFLKYSTGLMQAKAWAVKMLDATSKLHPGILIGTFADYGSFDECLAIKTPRSKSSNLEFQGSSCAVHTKLPYPPLPEKFSVVKLRLADENDTLGGIFRVSVDAIIHKWFRLIVCVPSKCSLPDMQFIAQKVSNMSGLTIKIPMCYVKEDVPLHAIHYAVLTALAILFVMVVLGTLAESQFAGNMVNISDSMKAFLVAFSFPTNLCRLMSASGGSAEFKCLHGIKAFSIGWVLLAHTYLFLPNDLLKEPYTFKTWFSSLSFQVIHNSGPAVDTFFIISGLLVSFGGIKSLEKVNGKLNIPLLILQRYLRLTPSLLLLMGLVFFLPLISSGPFWYESVDPQLESCRNYWWATLLYISNWMGIKKGCLVNTWYTCADLQLHIFSLFILIIIFRYAKIGLSLLVTCIVISCAAVGIQTLVHNLPATMLISSTDESEVYRTFDHIHIHTMTHLGPHCIGMVLGYYIYKHKEIKLKMWLVTFGWCMSTALALAAVLGIYRFATGDETSRAVSILYASLHRCAFSVAIAWVLFACIAGYGGPVNSLLSFPAFAPLSRLAFMVYLLHPLVVWTRLGSLRERPVTTHFDFVYLLLGNTTISFALAVPFYLLLEAPLSNLNRMVFSGAKKSQQENKEPKKQDYAYSNEAMESNHINPLTESDQTIQKTRM